MMQGLRVSGTPGGEDGARSRAELRQCGSELRDRKRAQWGSLSLRHHVQPHLAPSEVCGVPAQTGDLACLASNPTSTLSVL